jgi:hypothetical protein
MRAEAGLSVGVLVALAGFFLLFALVLWLGLKQSRDLHRWLDRKVASEGWVLSADQSVIAERGWNWFESLHSGRGVNVERLAVNPGAGVSEAAFTVVTRRYGGRFGGKRNLGAGLIARLPRAVSPPLLAVPQTAGLRLYERFFSFDLPPVPASDPLLGRIWSISSPSPEAAAELLETEAALRSALIVTAEDAFGYDAGELQAGAGSGLSVGRRPRLQVLILEFRDDRAALIGGPKTVGRQPFSDLEHLAGRLVEKLH